ncbi:MAG: glutamine synthetase type III, partial [Empedobacter falsenii]
IGQQLTKVLEELEGVSTGKLSPEEKTDLKLNVVGKIPDVLLDNTDRNRTSPFAFTGNKFEFRAVGSTANCANAMTTLNAIVAKQLIDFKKEVDALIETGLKKDEAIFNVLREYIKETKNILFEGDGYSKEWEEEAARRGLSNHKTTPSALKAKVSQKSLDLFSELNVMNNTEVEARYEIELEDYIKKIQIEGRVLGDIVRNHIIPTAFKYQNILIKNIKGFKDIFGDDYEQYAGEQLIILKKISMHVNELNAKLHLMMDARKEANVVESLEEKAYAYCDKVKPYYDEIRYHADKLELMVDNEYWVLTKYRELLFTR